MSLELVAKIGSPPSSPSDVKAHIGQIQTRVKQIEKAAALVIGEDAGLREQYQILTKVPGVARRSAILLLTELAVLDPTMTVKQIVGHAGLDPRAYESESSVQKPPRISKIGNARLRAVLYMNALTAIRHERGAGSFCATPRTRQEKDAGHRRRDAQTPARHLDRRVAASSAIR